MKLCEESSVTKKKDIFQNKEWDIECFSKVIIQNIREETDYYLNYEFIF